jgi:hypothetical protein
MLVGVIEIGRWTPYWLALGAAECRHLVDGSWVRGGHFGPRFVQAVD